MAKMKTIAGSRSGLMGFHGLAHIEKATVVWKTEGPADMLALMAIIPDDLLEQHVVVTNSGGAGEIPDHKFLEYFTGKTVYILHDADKPGQGIPEDSNDHRVFGARLWAQESAKFASICKNVQLPYEIADSKGKDVRDYINEGATYAEILALADAAPPIDPDPPESSDEAPQALMPNQETYAEEKICHDIRLDVLGEMPSGTVRAFSFHHHKTVEIKDVARLTYEKLLQLCGPPAREKVVQDGRVPPGFHGMNDVKNAIGMLAGYRRIGREDEVGAGIWRRAQHGRRTQQQYRDRRSR